MKPPIVTIILFGMISSSVLSQNEDDKKSDNVNDEPAAELEFTKWSGDIVVPDPVALSLDDEGRVWVTQTQRRKSQDLDIRNNRDWIPDDVGLETVEDKRTFFQEQLSPENSAANVERVDDMNGDGSHDYRDLMVLSEKIHLLEDRDGDGTADHMQLYADGFATEVTGIAAGVLWHEGDVYSTIAPDVWKLRDTDGDGTADTREVMATGFGLHIAYAGHDMHGLTVGPDGRIYWSVGDKGVSVTSEDGERFHYPNQGAVMRCDPDGSNFEIFAHGLRNVQELAFDEYGNLFGVDNDSDQPGERERFVYIVKDSDAGWRCNYQYRGSDYNPWVEEHLWEVSGEGQPAYLMPPIVNYEDGPAGFVYNPGTALGEEWAHTFFMTEAPRGNQWAFRTEPNGASFRMVDSQQIGAGIPLVGLAWGPDGGLYSVDWGGGYPLNQSGAVWKIDAPEGDKDPRREQTAEWMRTGYGELGTKKLVELLAWPDQRVRLKAQFQLVRNGDLAALKAALTSNSDQLARVHAVWGLGQLARAGDQGAIKTLAAQLDDADTEIQAQILKIARDLERGSFPAEVIPEMMGSDKARVQFFAAMAAGQHGVKDAVNGVIAMLEANAGEDVYLRHAGAMALAGSNAAAYMVDHPSVDVRLAAVVALRENADPAVVAFLKDKNQAVATEAAMAIHDDFSIPAALSDLAASLKNTKWQNETFVRRAINANYRLGDLESAVNVLHYATRTDQPGELREEALHALKDWVSPDRLDRVTGRSRDLEARDASAMAARLAAPLSDLVASSEGNILRASMEAANALEIDLNPEALLTLLRNQNADVELRVVSLQSLATREAIEIGLGSASADLRIAAAELYLEESKDDAVSWLATQFNNTNSNQELQAIIGFFAEAGTAEADALLSELAEALAKGQVPADLQLDVLNATASRDIETSFPRPAEDALAEWIECLEGGSVEAGRDLFVNHIAAQCARCHKVEDGSGSIIGPNLKNVGGKDRRYLLEALVLPQATVTKGYGNIVITKTDGSVVMGQLRGESEKAIEVRDPASRKTNKIPMDQIASKSDAMSVMPPMNVILQKKELRDMVAYLASLKSE